MPSPPTACCWAPFSKTSGRRERSWPPSSSRRATARWPGWGSPFLLVPEATTVDEDTLRRLAAATQGDYVLSDASPLGVPFNNFRRSSSDAQRKQRIAKGRPGSPCHKKFLAFNTEFTAEPICTASRQYQHLKLT